jgi:hypothetical protein
MKNNPLLNPLCDLLKEYEGSLTEYELIRKLVAKGVVESDYAANPLALFQTHFLVMNGLYQLQQQWLAEGVVLRVSPLVIKREPATESMSIERGLADGGMHHFYLDWRNLETTEQGVNDLLDSFWKRFAAYGVTDNERDAALHTLGLEPSADYRTIKQQYRRLAMACHPDRGGDQQALQAINSAMETLNKAFGR